MRLHPSDVGGNASTVRSDPRHRTAAVVLAAGSGSRMGAEQNKVFLNLCGRRVVSWSIQALAQIHAVERVVMVIREQDRKIAHRTLDREIEDLQVDVVVGGDSRRQSELFALRHLAPGIAAGDISLVLIHDGARPILSPSLVKRLIRVAADHDAAYPALQTDDIRRLRSDGTVDMVDTQIMLRAQTPQVFRADALLDAYERAEADGFDGPDTVSLWERYHEQHVQWVSGDPRNIKITYPEDLFEAERILEEARFNLD